MLCRRAGTFTWAVGRRLARPGVGVPRACASCVATGRREKVLPVSSAQVLPPNGAQVLPASSRQSPAVFVDPSSGGDEELKDQVASLAAQCESLAVEVQRLAAMLKQRQVSNCRNLMERQAMEEGLEAVPLRRHFRPKNHMIANQPTHVSQFDNTTVAQLALQGSHPAHKEQLIREIMYKDGVDWATAHEKLYEMDEFNERLYWLQTMPYRVGITISIVGGIAAVMMVFSRPVAELYGTKVAGEELPEGVASTEDMTRNQVGTWTWSWMEPMIGTASFVLLCAQFTRAQAWKLNMRPYTESMQRMRADRLATQYPTYNRGIVRQWGKHLPMVDYKFFPTYRRNLSFKGL